MTGPERHALVVGVLPERSEGYFALHRAVWPQVEAPLTSCHVTNYSILLTGDPLFADYGYIGEDHDAGMARIAEDRVTRNRWTRIDPCQVRIVEERVPGALWRAIDEIWHGA